MHTVDIGSHEVFLTLADPTRIRILRLLAVTGVEASLRELADSLPVPEYKVWQHLQVLRQAGLLTAVKNGRWANHRLVRNVPLFECLYAALRELPNENQVFSRDLIRFQELMYLREHRRGRAGIRARRVTQGTG